MLLPSKTALDPTSLGRVKIISYFPGDPGDTSEILNAKLMKCTKGEGNVTITVKAKTEKNLVIKAHQMVSSSPITYRYDYPPASKVRQPIQSPSISECCTYGNHEDRSISTAGCQFYGYQGPE